MSDFERHPIGTGQRITDLEEALDWALREGASYSYDHSKIWDSGCGCCSGEIHMTDIPMIVITKMKEKQDETRTTKQMD